VSSAKPNTLLGIALMLAAMAIFPLLDVLAKTLGQQGLPVMQAVWARMALGALMTAPLLVYFEGKQSLRPKDAKLNASRGFFIVGTTFCFFSAMQYLGIAQTLSIYFVQPILITAMAPFLLGEKVGPRRWLAVLIGFCGVLIIIRPGIIAINPGTLLALLGGLCSAFVLIISRKLAGGNSALANTFYSSGFGALLASVIMLWQWQWPTPHQWALMVGIGFIGTFANWLVIRAFEYCEASLLAPFGYTEMITAVILGWYFFSEFPDNYTFLGVAVLIACATYISLRERKLSKTT
jgi:drug/metabolite transporter (DMT)-like permease